MRQNRPHRSPFIDPLEDRRLLAASPLSGGPDRIWDDAPAAVVMPAASKPAAKKTVAASNTKTTRSSPTNLVGTWTGTAKTASTGQVVAISMKIDKQSG